MGPDLTDRLVQPFYLSMMRCNAVEAEADLIERFVRTGAESTVDDVVWLLARPWRETVMGAWLSLFHDAEPVGGSLLVALDASAGSLDAPPLAVAAAVLHGSEAVPTLVAYVDRDVANGWGAAGFVGAAISHLGGSMAPPPTTDDQGMFSRMLAVAELLRSKA